MAQHTRNLNMYDRLKVIVTDNSNKALLQSMAESFARIRETDPGFVGPSVIQR
jgi:hypothetical protein